METVYNVVGEGSSGWNKLINPFLREVRKAVKYGVLNKLFYKVLGVLYPPFDEVFKFREVVELQIK